MKAHHIVRCMLLFEALKLSAACSGPERTAGQTIVVDSLRVLRGVGDTIDLLSDEPPSISEHGYHAVLLHDPPSGGVAIYDSAGRFLKRVTRRGGGPGEVRNVLSAGFGPGDTLWVLDQPLRLHAYTPPPALEYVRTVQFERITLGRISRFGVLVSGAMRNTAFTPPELIGWDGRLLARFGRAAEMNQADVHMGAVFAIDSTRIWSASSERYEVDEISAGGTLVRRIAPNVEWFRDVERSRQMPWEARPSPQINAISVDDQGLLWVLVRRAHRDWAPDPTLRPSTAGPIAIRGLPSLFQMQRLYETVLEVFDPESGTLIASRTFDGTVFGFGAPRMLAAVGETSEGHVSMHLLQVDLR